MTWNHLYVLLKLYPCKINFINNTIIVTNPNLTIDLLADLGINWRHYPSIALNPNITWEFIQSNPDFPWNWDLVSDNPNITMEIVKKYQSIPWNMKIIYYRLDPLNPIFDWNMISDNPNITLKMVLDNKDEPWNWNKLTRNPAILWDKKQYILNTNLNFSNFTRNDYINYFFADNEQDITLETVIQSPKLFSENPTLTWQIVHNNPYTDWDWGKIFGNKFNKDTYILEKYISTKYFNKWKYIFIRNTEQRKYWKIIYSASMDLIKLRMLDCLNNTSQSKLKFNF